MTAERRNNCSGLATVSGGITTAASRSPGEETTIGGADETNVSKQVVKFFTLHIIYDFVLDIDLNALTVDR